MFAKGITESQSKIETADKCNSLYLQEYDSIDNIYESQEQIDRVESNFRKSIQNCIDENSTGASEVFAWMFSFIFIVGGIVGIVFIGHRFVHELKHVAEPTAGRES